MKKCLTSRLKGGGILAGILAVALGLNSAHAASPYTNLVALTSSPFLNVSLYLTAWNQYMIGSTYIGGTNNAGSLYALNTLNNTVSTIYSFTGGTNGSSPVTPPVIVGNALYGATEFGGGANSNSAVVYRINGDGTGYTPLAVIHDGTNGLHAVSPIVALAGGTELAVLSTLGANHGYVTVVTTNGSLVTQIALPSVGQFLQSSLALSTNNTLYVSPGTGGPTNGFNGYGQVQGMIVEVNPTSGLVTNRFGITSNLYAAYGVGIDGIAVSPSGGLYLTTSSGTLINVNQNTWTPTLVAGTPNANNPGVNLATPVLLADGSVYLASSHGSGYSLGELSRVGKSGGLEVIHYSTSPGPDSSPVGLTLGNDGDLYGLNLNATYNVNELFRLQPVPYTPSITSLVLNYTNRTAAVSFISTKGQAYYPQSTPVLTIAFTNGSSLMATGAITAYLGASFNPNEVLGVYQVAVNTNGLIGAYLTGLTDSVPVVAPLTTQLIGFPISTNSGGSHTNAPPPPP